MSVLFHLSGSLAKFSQGETEIEIRAAAVTVGQAFDRLWSTFPGLRDRVLTEQGQVRPHVNVFLEDDNIRDLNGLSTAINENAEICIFPAVSGGAV